jgi:small subunit ribosomal protein S9
MVDEVRVVQAVGRRKAAFARATLKKGTGRVFINRKALENYGSGLVRARISEPFLVAPAITKKVDIYVDVSGGGYMGQADAVRTAIARGIIKWSMDPKLRETFKQHDWTLVKSDVRFKESKKPGGPGARAKFQKSYR